MFACRELLHLDLEGVDAQAKVGEPRGGAHTTLVDAYIYVRYHAALLPALCIISVLRGRPRLRTAAPGHRPHPLPVVAIGAEAARLVEEYATLSSV